MQAICRFWLVLGFMVSIPGVAWGQVTWDTKALDLPMSPGLTDLEGMFAFTNEGEGDVTITSVKTSCGCTTAALEQKTYGPGESGQIEVTFNVGDRVGPQVKKVVVRTDDPATPVTTLTLRTTIPKWVELKPRLLMWKADEPLEAKTVEVTFHDVEPVVLTQAETDAAGLALEVEELEEGRRYVVTVRPERVEASDELRLLVHLKIESDEQSEDAKLLEKRAEMLRFLVRVTSRSPGVSPEASSESVEPSTPQAEASPEPVAGG